jgi:hypothetical protein
MSPEQNVTYVSEPDSKVHAAQQYVASLRVISLMLAM